MPLTPPPLIQQLAQGNVISRAWGQFFTDLYQQLKSLANGTVNSVGGTSPIVSSGGNTPTISLANSPVIPGIYTNPDITVNAHGLITGAANGLPPLSNPMTTVGDLIVGGFSGIPDRLPVGADGQFLTADSTQVDGLGWSSPPVNMTHDESLTDGNSNFIFAAGDVITVVGVTN